MATLKQIAKARAELARRFPQCFKPKGALKVPLAVGIREEIFERVPYVPFHVIHLAIRDYVSGPKYQNTIFNGAPRYNLDGEVVGFVTEEQASWSQRFMLSLYDQWQRQAA